MARLLRGLSAFVLLLLVSALFPLALAAPKKSSSVARKEDIPFIKCQVCEKIAHQIYQQVKKKEAEISPKKVPPSFLHASFSSCLIRSVLVFDRLIPSLTFSLISFFLSF